MQTFLPYDDFTHCANILDGARLRKQIVEGSQILTTLAFPEGERVAWANHPAVRMWRGYEGALNAYCLIMQAESRKRGYTSNLHFTNSVHPAMPPWLSHPLLHLSHKANLLRKDPKHYRPHFGVDIEPAAGYWWPIVCGKASKEHTEWWENRA